MAVASKIDICNMALAHLGKPSITSLTDGSPEARTCARLYDGARRASLVRSPWTFARRTRALSVVADNPLSDFWSTRYDLPKDMLKIHRLLEDPSDPMGNHLPIASYVEEGSVFANTEGLYLLFIVDSEQTQRWSALFDDAVALQLAARMAPTLTRRKGDVNELRDAYVDAIGLAAEVDGQQESATYTFHEGGYADDRAAGSVWE